MLLRFRIMVVGRLSAEEFNKTAILFCDRIMNILRCGCGEHFGLPFYLSATAAVMSFMVSSEG